MGLRLCVVEYRRRIVPLAALDMRWHSGAGARRLYVRADSRVVTGSTIIPGFRSIRPALAFRDHRRSRHSIHRRLQMTSFYRALATTVVALMLASCASPGGNMPTEQEIRTGVIEQITLVQVKSNHDHGVGAILGGIAGAGIGSLIGAGTGRDVAIAAGAIAGAIGGNYAQQRYYDKPEAAQQIYVRLQSGVLVMITQPVNPVLANGQRVYVEGQGSSARVIPR